MATWASINLQDRASPIIEQLIYFHDHALIIILIILRVVALSTSLGHYHYTNLLDESVLQNVVLLITFFKTPHETET